MSFARSRRRPREMAPQDRPNPEFLWNQLKTIGKTIEKLGKRARIENAKVALKLVDLLDKSNYHLQTEERIVTFRELITKFASYLDGDDSGIQSAVTGYFPNLQGQAGIKAESVDVDYFAKQDGVQTGFVCNVNNGYTITRYYIKTHQHGPTPDNARSLQCPDSKELFIYKLLHIIGIGPEVHFVIPTHGSKRTIYIVTKDAELTLLSDLTVETHNGTALLQMDLISRILCLRDCTTNPTNCGQVEKEPMIVDFRIETQNEGYKKPDILERFLEGIGYQYTGLMQKATSEPVDVKLSVIRFSLEKWNLIAKIDVAVANLSAFISEVKDRISFTNGLEQYVNDVKETITNLQSNCETM